MVGGGFWVVLVRGGVAYRVRDSAHSAWSNVVPRAEIFMNPSDPKHVG